MNAPRGVEGSATKHPWATVLVEASTSWGEGIVRGVVNFAREHGRWLLHVEPAGLAPCLKAGQRSLPHHDWQRLAQ